MVVILLNKRNVILSYRNFETVQKTSKYKYLTPEVNVKFYSINRAQVFVNIVKC